MVINYDKMSLKVVAVNGFREPKPKEEIDNISQIKLEGVNAIRLYDYETIEKVWKLVDNDQPIPLISGECGVKLGEIIPPLEPPSVQDRLMAVEEALLMIL